MIETVNKVVSHVSEHSDWKPVESRTWLEVEMDETCALLRKKLEHINEQTVERIDHHDIWEIKNIYKTMWYIKQLRG